MSGQICMVVNGSLAETTRHSQLERGPDGDDDEPLELGYRKQHQLRSV